MMCESPEVNVTNEDVDARLTILTATGEVLALCYAANCNEAESCLAALLRKGYEEVNVLPKPIQGHTSTSELQFSVQAEDNVEIIPPVQTLHLRLLKCGEPHQLRFKCYSAIGQNVFAQLIVKEDGEVVDQEHIDMICMKKEKRSATGNGAATVISGGSIENLNMDKAKVNVIGKQEIHNQHTVHSSVYQYQNPVNQAVCNPVTSSANEGPGFLRRFFLSGFHARRFVAAVNELSYAESLGGIADKYQEQNLCEPDYEVYCRMKMPTRFYHGELAMTGHLREHNTGPLNESEMITFGRLKRLITTVENKDRVIAVLGMAGRGKSTLIKRLVRDTILSKQSWWMFFSTPTYTQRFKLVRFLSIRDIAEANYLADARDVLFSQGTLPKLQTNDIHFGYEWAIEHESEVLFAFDGLDQASWVIPSDFPKIGYHEKADVAVVVANILSGNLFKGAKILLTSREFSVSSLSEKLRPKTIITMMGLDLKDAEKVFNHLTSSVIKCEGGAFRSLSPGIKPLCTIPLFLVYCAVIFIVHPDLYPQTMSAILHEILRIFLHSEHAEEKKKEHVIAFFKSISLKAILEKRLTFTWQEFQSAGITPKMISQFAINVPGQSTLSQKLFERDYKVFFNHQMLQEHFASMEICEQNCSVFQSYVSGELLQPRMSVVRRFVCGLLSTLGENSELVSIEDREKKWSIFKESLQQQAKKALSSDEKLELLALLFESRDQDLIQSLVTEIDFSDVAFTPATAYALATILTSCRHLRLFSLQNCRLNKESLAILDCVTEKANLQVDIVQLDLSMARLLKPRCFIENLHAGLTLLLCEYHRITTTLLSSVSKCQSVVVILDVQSRQVISFFYRLSSGEEPLILPVPNEIIMQVERPHQMDILVIGGPFMSLLKLENLIKHLRPKLLILFFSEGSIISPVRSKWSLGETYVVALEIVSGEYYELIPPSVFCQETVKSNSAGILTTVPTWPFRGTLVEVLVIEGTTKVLQKLANSIKYLQPKVLIFLVTDRSRNWTELLLLDETYVIALEVSNDEYCELLLPSPFCQETAVPDLYQEKIIATLRKRVQKVDIVVIEGPFTSLLKLEKFVKNMGPRILILLVTDRSDYLAVEKEWTLKETYVIVFKVNLVEYCELLPSYPFCHEYVIPWAYRENIIATLKKRVLDKVGIVVIEKSRSYITQCETFIINYLKPKVVVLLLTGDSDISSMVFWFSSETCVLAFVVSSGRCKLVRLSASCRETVIPDGCQEKISTAITRRLQSVNSSSAAESLRLLRRLLLPLKHIMSLPPGRSYFTPMMGSGMIFRQKVQSCVCQI